MTRRHVIIALQVIAAVVAFGLVLIVEPNLAMERGDLSKVAAFAVSLLALASLQVGLPEGDSLETTTAIAFAAAAVLPLHSGVPIALAAKFFAWILSGEGRRPWRLLEQLSRRVLLMVLAHVVVGPSFMSATHVAPSMTTPYLRLGWAILLFVGLDVVLEAVHVSLRLQAPFYSSLVSGLRLQGRMAVAQSAVAVLAVFLMPGLGVWALFICVALVLVMRQSIALLLEVRSSYKATVEMMARSIEANDPERRGHAERVANMVTDAARHLGIHGQQLDDCAYAALFHDVGLLGADDDEEAPDQLSSEVLSTVGFLSGAIPILRITDSAVVDNESLDERHLIGAYLVASFSAFDVQRQTGSTTECELAQAIGSRLYAKSRRPVDRAIRSVQRQMELSAPSGPIAAGL